MVQVEIYLHALSEAYDYIIYFYYIIFEVNHMNMVVILVTHDQIQFHGD